MHVTQAVSEFAQVAEHPLTIVVIGEPVRFVEPSSVLIALIDVDLDLADIMTSRLGDERLFPR